MNLFLNYAIMAIAILFVIFYIIIFVLNLMRSNKVINSIKENPVLVKAIISKIVTQKKRTYVQVRYTSPSNKMLFETYFEYNEKEWADRYQVGDEVDIICATQAENKKVYSFPVFLTGDKIKMNFMSMILDLAIVGFAGYILFMVIMSMSNKGVFQGSDISPMDVHSGMMLIIYIIMHFMLMTYAISRLTQAPGLDSQRYLEIYGYIATAEVKTFKFVGQKNEKGFKESEMEIEFCDYNGNIIKTKCNSSLYSETQEQYVNILYNPTNSKQVTYIRLPEKQKKNKDK